ncbi:MAG TPA: MarR family transcriptional regulator [Sinomonas sp.]|nr:MarR family transcriptional regulator [Sinomonas sp.]
MPVEPQTARALIHTVFDLQRTLRCLAHEHKAHEVGTAEAGVLRMISEFGGRAVDIAEKLNVSAPVLSRHIAELQERGLVARRRDPEDRRAQLLELTEAGTAKLAEVEEARTARLLEFLSGWEESEASACTDSMQRLNDTLRKASQPMARTASLENDDQKEEALAAH